MMLSSLKRSHASVAAAAAISNNNSAPEEESGGKLAHQLSQSLRHFLLPSNNETSTKGANEKNKDVYHQYLNSPPNNSNNEDNEETQQWHKLGQKWLSKSMSSVGVGSNINALKFWKEHGRENDIETYADGRYMVWFVKEILLGLATKNMSTNSTNHNGGVTTTYDDFSDHMMGVVEQWHMSILQLLNTNGSKTEGNDQTIGGGQSNPNKNDYDNDDDDDTAGVMWLMLLQNAHLTPSTLREAMEVYSSPQERYEQCNINSVNLESIDDDGDNDTLSGKYFAWPSFFRHVTLEASKVHGPNKRRRSNNSKALRLGGDGSESKNNDWWPLLGYAITYAFLSTPNHDMTTQQKFVYLKDNILDSLPSMMNIPNFDYNIKKSLLSGVMACVLDELGEWIVLDGLVLGDSEEEVSLGEGEMNDGICDQQRASVDQVVDLLLVDGVLTQLAKLTRTPLANLVAEVADALLNYSTVNHKVRNQTSKEAASENEGNAGYPLYQHLVNDAKKVVHFIETANPQLVVQLRSRKFITSQYYSPGDDSAPLHPIVIYTRAVLSSNSLPQCSKVCRELEDCSGIDDATKRHCYFLLLEKFQDTGVLFEDGWNSIEGGEATLANITVGALGLDSVRLYLENVVLEAHETLLSRPASNPLHKERAKQELLCVKDAVRRTMLKMLLPRAYSPHEALVIANEIAGACYTPQLESISEATLLGGGNGSDTAVDTVYRILKAPSLYSIWNENLVPEEETEVIENDELVESKKLGLVQEEGLVQADVQPQKEINEMSPRKESQAFALAVNNEEVPPPIEDEDNEVIDLGDTDDEQEVAAKPSIQQQVAADSREEDQIDSSVNDDDSEEPSHHEKQQDGDVTYPPHYHNFAGNYSESDDYDVEDEEEADRRLAFEGNYDEQEGQGDSDSDRHNQGQESDDGLIEILDSSGDEENEQQEEMMNQEEEDESSEGEMSNETDDLNEAVDNYIAKEEEMKDGEVDDDHDKTVATSTEITERVDAVASAREDQHDAEILKEAVHEYIIPSTGAKAGDVKETGENNPHEMSKTKPVIEGNTTLEVAEKKITGADVAQNEAETPSIPAAENTSDPAHETTDTDDVILADDEHESIDTEDDRRSLGDVPPFDDTKEGEDKDDKSKSEDNCEQNDKEESKDEGERGEKPSLLVAAAMSTQRQGNNFDQSSTPNRFELPPEKFYDELLQEKDLSFDDTSAAMVASHHLADADDLGDDSSEEDDGYVPDVEVSEAERADRETEDAARKKAMVDDGYIPDASEASEVEQIEDNGKRSASRDVRFETSLESKAGTFDTAPSIDAAQSIDEGYLPDESEVERGGEALVRHTQGIDRGYLPDGHTTPGDATEEDQGDDTAAVQKEMESSDNKAPDDEASQEKPIPAEETRLDDTIDEGYLPSAMEEELSEKEDITMATDSHVEEQGSAHANTNASEYTKRKDDMLVTTTNQQVPESDALEGAAEQATSSLGALSNNIDDTNTPKNSSHNVTSAAATTEPKSGPNESITTSAENLERNKDEDADAKACGAAVDEKVVEMKHHTELAGATIESKNNDIEQPKFPQEEQVPKSDSTISVGKGAADVPSQGSAMGNVAAAERDKTGRSEENMASDHNKDEPPQDFTQLTVVQLKEKLRELNLHVTGRKPELIDRLNGHLYPNLKNTGVVEEAQSTKTTSLLAEDQPSAKQEAEKPTPSKSSSAVRRSNREKKPSLKVAEDLEDTPISALSNPVDSETDDDDFVEAEEFETKEADSPGVPKSIVTGKRRKKPQPSLAAVPEDNALEEAKIGEKVVSIKSAGEKASKRSTRSQSTRLTKKREDSKSESAASSSVSTKASKRTAASVSTRASKRVKKSATVAAASAGTWKCHKCNATNSPERKRCEGCLGWKGGHREGHSNSPPSTKEVSSAMTSKKSPPGSSSKLVAVAAASQDSPKKRGPGRPRKKLELGGDTSVASSRRSAQQKSKSKVNESPSVSVATRRSTRSRVSKKL